MNDNTRQDDVMDPMEGMAMRHKEVKGGSATAAPILHDLVFEPMDAATITFAYPCGLQEFLLQAGNFPL